MGVPSIFSRRFIMVAGKGGVGRTTVAAALARAAQRAGKRVLLAQMESPDRLGRLLGTRAPVGSQVSDLGDGLSAVNMTPKVALHEYGLMVLHYETLYRALFENKAVRGFLGAIPGLDAYAMLGKAWWHTTEMVGSKPRYDLTIVDGPASGHAVRVMTIPKAILEAVPKGPLSRDAAAMSSLFADPARAALLAVTLPEELPARETAVLVREANETLRMPLGPLVVNAMPPSRFSDAPLGRLLAALPANEQATHSSVSRALASTLTGARLLRERRQDAEAVLARLRRDPGLPTLELPRLPASNLGPAEVAALADVLYQSPLFQGGSATQATGSGG